MQVTAIRVQFSRRVSPAQYESMGAEVDLNILTDGETSPEALIDQAGQLARTKVYEMLGLKAPTLAPTAETPVSSQAAVSVDAPQTEPEKQKRTRRTKAEMEAARAAEAVASQAAGTPETKPATTLFADATASPPTPPSAAPPVNGGLFSQVAGTPASNPTGLFSDAAKTSAPATSIEPEDWETQPAEISDARLSAICAQHAQRTSGKASDLVKQWKLKHGIPRIIELKPEFRAQLVKELEAL